MKYTTALGGFFGFIIGVAGGLYGGREAAFIFLQAGVASAVGAVLFHWLHYLLLKGAADSIREKKELARRKSAADSARNVQPAR
jgi:hypothetical protein